MSKNQNSKQLSVAQPAPTPINPEWIRLPKSPERDPWTGLSRSVLASLISGDAPPVKSIVVRRRGKTRGSRLVNLKSLLGYLSSLE